MPKEKIVTAPEQRQVIPFNLEGGRTLGLISMGVLTAVTAESSGEKATPGSNLKFEATRAGLE